MGFLFAKLRKKSTNKDMINLIKVEIEKGVFVLLSAEDIEKYKLTPVKEVIEVQEVQTSIAPKKKIVKLQTKKGE